MGEAAAAIASLVAPLRLVLLASAGALAACAAPTQRVADFAAAHRMERSVADGSAFRHLVLHRAGDGGPVLHVYIEHDGTPWIAGREVARDPTPSRPLALRLMARDRAPALYLGRPCYFEVESDPPCGPLLWTHRRYSAEVVDSMARALARVANDRGYDKLVLIGHSGGGTLAVLVAARLAPGTVQAVVTIGANLDVEAWAAHHGYTPLAGSLNPASQPPLPPQIAVVHYAGSRDAVVPLRTLGSYRSMRPGEAFVLRERFDHACCWEDDWPSLLAEALGRPRREAEATGARLRPDIGRATAR